MITKHISKSKKQESCAQHPTAGLFVPISCLSRFGLDSGYIYLKFTSLHLKELVLTDRPLHQCQSMKGMNEQSDLIVLTVELKEQKYIRVLLEDTILGSCCHKDLKEKCFLSLSMNFFFFFLRFKI